MSTPKPQSLEHHARYVPVYHFLLSFVLFVLLVYTIVRTVRHPWLYASWMDLLVAVALVVIWWYSREFAKTVQDRVIRLEEQLRMERLLPADLKARAGELTVRQIIALRFASDAELAGLVRKALDEHLSGRDIKRSVQTWRPDHLRA